MTPLDLRTSPPRSCHAQLDGLVFLPRTIDKLRAQLPGGHCGEYFISGPIGGLSGYLLERLGIEEGQLLEVVRGAAGDEEVARWLRERVDTTRYPALNETLQRIKPKHALDPEAFNELYARVLREHPQLTSILDIVDADDRHMFPNHS